MLVTARRIFYEHQNEMTNHVMKYLIDMIKPMIVNTFHEVMHTPRMLSYSFQIQASPTNPAPSRILYRAKIIGTTQISETIPVHVSNLHNTMTSDYVPPTINQLNGKNNLG